MAARVRLGGHARDRLGREVTWSIADGERGRRWREVAGAPNGGAGPALTLETGHAGQWLRLELATDSGLLSLHPDRSGAVHGNVVAAEGIRHLDLGLLDPPLVDVRDSFIGEIALCRALERRVTAGEGSVVTVIQVGPSLETSLVELAARRLDARTWELTDSGGIRTVAMGDRGTPPEGEPSARWPLETGS